MTTPALRSEDAVGQTEDCLSNWECEAITQRIDCRPIVRRATGPVLRIAFSHNGVFYQLEDFGAQAETLLADAKFRRAEPEFCVIPPIH